MSLPPIDPIGDGSSSVREGLRGLLLRIYNFLTNLSTETWIVDLANSLNMYRVIGRTGSTLTTSDSEQYFNLNISLEKGKEGVITVSNGGSNPAIIRIEATSGGNYYGWAILKGDTVVNPGETMYHTFQGPWYLLRVVYKNQTSGANTTIKIHGRWT